MMVTVRCIEQGPDTDRLSLVPCGGCRGSINYADPQLKVRAYAVLRSLASVAAYVSLSFDPSLGRH